LPDSFIPVPFIPLAGERALLQEPLAGGTCMNSKGQSLVEYLIIVSLVAVGSIAIMRGLGQTVYVRFANITNALQGKSPEIQPDAVKEEHYQKRGLDDFFKSAGN
jgi:pilus assembly protein Flp/PilA